jgi:hypothetical protein
MENIDMTNLSSLREQITLNDITKLYAVSDYDSDNPLIKL